MQTDCKRCSRTHPRLLFTSSSPSPRLSCSRTPSSHAQDNSAQDKIENLEKRSVPHLPHCCVGALWYRCEVTLRRALGHVLHGARSRPVQT
eukprot:1805783-Rhodomonas_salina.2